MTYKVKFTGDVDKQLAKLDKHQALLITSWLRKSIEGSSNPRQYGKALVGDKKGLWRYRVGDYRIIAKIEDDKVIVLVVEIGHRRDIYKK